MRSKSASPTSKIAVEGEASIASSRLARPKSGWAQSGALQRRADHDPASVGVVDLRNRGLGKPALEDRYELVRLLEMGEVRLSGRLEEGDALENDELAEAVAG